MGNRVNDEECSDKCVNTSGNTKVYKSNLFVCMFSLLYCIISMSYGSINVIVLVILVFYLLFNLFLEKGCIEACKKYFGYDVIYAVIFSVISAYISILIGSFLKNSSSLLLFPPGPSNGEKCSMPSKQNFVCNVWKNGEIIAKSPNIPNS
jgi:hypothetical protein